MVRVPCKGIANSGAYRPFELFSDNNTMSHSSIRAASSEQALFLVPLVRVPLNSPVIIPVLYDVLRILEVTQLQRSLLHSLLPGIKPNQAHKLRQRGQCLLWRPSLAVIAPRSLGWAHLLKCWRRTYGSTSVGTSQRMSVLMSWYARMAGVDRRQTRAHKQQIGFFETTRNSIAKC